MCLSKISQLLYGVIALCIIGLVLGSMFTPGWRRIETQIKEEGTEKLINGTIARGIFPLGCATVDVNGKGVHLVDGTDACEKWWKDQPGYEKAVIALMILALLATVAAFVWNVLTFFCCIGKGWIFRPLPSLACASTVLLLVAIIVFYFSHHKDIEIVKQWNGGSPAENNVSYSFYLALGAMLGSLLNAIVGSLIVQTAERCI